MSKQLIEKLDVNTKSTKTETANTNVWELGDYRSISTMLPQISFHLVNLLGIQPGESVLDVACGNGNTAITARRRGANVTGVDFTSELLEIAKEEERIAGISGINWKKADAHDLPFEDESFDVVLSTFGHMFATQPDIAAKELIRVTKKGGKIGLATWPPELAIGSIFRVNSKPLPQKPDSPPSPILWGNTDIIQQRLHGLSEIYFDRGTTVFPILSPNHFWEFMSTKYGPLIKVLEILKDSENQPELLRADFLKAIDPYVVENGLRLGYLLTVGKK
ncbi:methyltransferase type 11 [Candidatus Nitrosocosmicus sp.]|nr:methyltransferase type 11 [Candidatus Nitrosocosmicus sp.]